MKHASIAGNPDLGPSLPITDRGSSIEAAVSEAKKAWYFTGHWIVEASKNE
jgi:hypothetical protein